MSANTYLQVTELDFSDIRTNLKAYLKSQNQFADYDFDGSAMSTLLDVLAYNTHYNAYYLNMVANEMFLDTAQQRDSVVSRAKELGYTPVSSIGASAEIEFEIGGIQEGIPQITLPKNSKFSTTVDDVTYTYVTTSSTKINRDRDGAFKQNLIIREGEPLTFNWLVDSDSKRYIIPNENVDTSSIVVTVQESVNDTTITEYNEATNINQVFKTSPIYFIEESSDNKYEIIFGSGSLGKSLKLGNLVKVEYLVNNADATNGAKTFSVESADIGISYTTAKINSIVKNANGGRKQETIDSIKFSAPRNFQTQNRAVIAEDYERIILNENPDLQSVIAFGGEEADPPVNGKVLIAVKPFGEKFATENKKKEIAFNIKDRTPLAVDPVVIDAEYTYIIPSITTYYDTTRSSLTSSAVEQNIRDSIQKYATNSLERFGNRFRFSRFVRALDDTSNGSILNNDATIIMQKRVSPNLNSPSLVQVKFNNSIRAGSVSSTSFTYLGFQSYLGDDGLGNINIFRYGADNEKINIIPLAGTVDYTVGLIEVQNFSPSGISGIELKINATTENMDVIPLREQILIIEPDQASISVIGEQT
jgi:hypothetical protein